MSEEGKCMWTHGKDCALLPIFTYIYSLLIEKDFCDCQNVSAMLPWIPEFKKCVYILLSIRIPLEMLQWIWKLNKIMFGDYQGDKESGETRKKKRLSLADECYYFF